MAKFFTLGFFRYLSAGLGLALVAAGVMLFMQDRRIDSLQRDVTELTDWRTAMVGAVKDASGNDKVVHQTAAKQVRSMGQSITALLRGIEAQNTAISALETRYEQAKARAEQERQRRAAAIEIAQRLAQQLDAMAIGPPAQDTDAATRAAQDAAYKGGV